MTARRLAAAAPSVAVAVSVSVSLSLSAVGCGGGQRREARPASSEAFACNQRRAEYMVVGGLVAPESGVTMECSGDTPTITRWRTGADGQPQREAFALTGAQFEATWEKIDATGWRFLARECPGSRANDRRDRKKRAAGRAGNPIYTIDVGDGATTVSMSCTAAELPFPYDRLVNELDLRAAGFGDDAGAPH